MEYYCDLQQLLVSDSTIRAHDVKPLRNPYVRQRCFLVLHLNNIPVVLI